MQRATWLAAFVLAVLPEQALACDTRLVSGFDDVLRQADNTGLLRAARRLLQPDQTYAGMRELFGAMACPGSVPSFVVVSAISRAFEPRAERLLARDGYPAAELQFRRWSWDWSARRFKRARFEALFEQHPSAGFVLVMDNSDTSITLSLDLLAAHRARIAAIYLRETVERPLPDGVTPFLTAFDIAAHEFAAGRLEADDVARVADAILGADDPRHLVPDYAWCPTSPPPCATREPGIDAQCARIRERVARLCAARIARDAGRR